MAPACPAGYSGSIDLALVISAMQATHLSNPMSNCEPLMNKSDYLEHLQRALGGLPPETIAKTLAYYEQRFIDATAGGQSEEQVAASLDDPKKIAMTLRTSIHLASFQQRRNPATLLRMLVSAFGLLIFNLLMVVPALVYAALLATVYAAGLAFYIAGIAITASGLAGANELVLDAPFHELFHLDEKEDPDDTLQTRVSISEAGIQINQQPRAAGESSLAATAGEHKATTDKRTPKNAGAVLKRAEQLADSGVHIATELDEQSRMTQVMAGLGLVIGGIVIFLLGLVITQHTLIGIRRYVAMNFSMIKGS